MIYFTPRVKTPGRGKSDNASGSENPVYQELAFKSLRMSIFVRGHGFAYIFVNV